MCVHVFSLNMLPVIMQNSIQFIAIDRKLESLKRVGTVFDWFGLVWFYGISTIVGYLMLNPLYTCILCIYIYIYTF